jgi:hypothetical protein
MIEVWLIGGTWVTAIIAVGGVVVAWRRNGKHHAERDGRLEGKLENIMDKLDDPDNGLNAINTKVNEMKNHCSGVSGRLDERVKTTERDIRELKQG